jgi:hypothetical protein
MTMTPKPDTFSGNIANLPKALEIITQQNRWVVWRWELRTKKNGEIAWTKPPFQCSYPKSTAKNNDPSTWGSYQDAVAAVVAGKADGIGFMLLASEVAAADLDHVRDVTSGELLGWAQALCAEADSLGLYREITVSGCGLRFIGLSEGNKLHRKFLFNRSSHAGIELYRNCERYITISGLQEGSCEQLAEIGAYLETLLARYDGKPAPLTAVPSSEPLLGDLVPSLMKEVGDNPLDFNTAGPQSSYSEIRNIIENGAAEGQRSEQFQRVIWYLASKGWSAEEIADELTKYPLGIGFKYTNRLLSEVTRSFGKWQGERRAAAIGPAAGPRAGGPASAPPTPWPQIRIKSGELPRIVSEAEDALLQFGSGMYQRAGMLVRPVLNRSLKASDDRKTESWQLIPVTRPHLVETFCCAAQFLRYDKRGKKWVAVDAPDKVAEAYLHRQGRWKLPLLAGVVNTPFLRVDGSICESAGYDVESHLLLKPEKQVFPPVPQLPSKAAATAALKQLCELIATFPFVSDADRSVALAGMLTVLDRRSMATAPLIAFTARVAGTGKSLLVDLMSILATGRLMPVLSQGKDEQEFEKRLGASLMAGDACISVDNCEDPLSGVLLSQALTQSELDIRVLGYSKNIRTAMNATIFATGNNLEIAGDLARRCVLGALDAGMERPELRTFTTDVIEEAHRRRGELVVAGLTILRAWHVARANGEASKVDPFGSFDDWSCRVRESLVWLGETDPCDTVTKVRENDPKRDLLTVVIMQWKETLRPNNKYTVQNVIERAIVVPSFYNALMAVAAARTGGSISNASLGRWLKRVEGKIVSRFSLVQDGSSGGYPYWKLIER